MFFQRVVLVNALLCKSRFLARFLIQVSICGSHHYLLNSLSLSLYVCVVCACHFSFFSRFLKQRVSLLLYWFNSQLTAFRLK